jgi:hypothetical protein
LRNIATNIKHESGHFAVIVDGTQDVSGKEQEAICLRHVDEHLDVHETFVGLYEPPDATGATIAAVVEDVLLRFDLPLSKLRGQTYDDAANMAGQYHGCQALISKKTTVGPLPTLWCTFSKSSCAAYCRLHATNARCDPVGSGFGNSLWSVTEI